jgi:hypothetical protein
VYLRTLVVFSVTLLAGCDGGATVTVRNSSSAELRNVVLLGSCFRTPLQDPIKSGESQSFLVAPPCESGLGLEFVALGKRRVVKPAGYFEGSQHYVVTAEVRPDLTVQVSTDLAFEVDTSNK